MRALVVYESMFGNTQIVARAISDGLRPMLDVEEFEVGAAPTELTGVDLLVLGAPTHAWGLSRSRTREGLNPETGSLVSPGIGVREWLEAVAPTTQDTAAATFDTRFHKPHWLTGSAARAARKRLARKGFRVVVRPESFFVAGTRGPLIEGEAERARHWGETLVSVLTSETELKIG